MKRQIAAGAAWIAATRLGVNVLGMVSTLLLARLLMPQDFGLVALATTVSAIVSSLTELSLASALVQHRDPQDHHYDTAWTLNALRGLLIGTVVALCAWPMAAIYGDQRLFHLVLALGLVSMLNGQANPRLIQLTRDLVFRQEFLLGVVPKAVGLIASALVAIIWRSYWALIVGAAVAQLITLVLSYALVPYRPRPSLAAIRELMAFSGWLSLTGIVNTANYRMDTLFLGYFLNPAAVGHYNLGDNLASLPTREATAPIAHTLFPAFARLAATPEHLPQAYQRAQTTLCAVAFPVGIGFAAVAKPVVLLALGVKWLPAVLVIQILSTVMALQALGWSVYEIGLALGRSKALFQRDLGIFLVRLPLMLAGLWTWGLLGVLLARIVSGTLALAVNMTMVQRLIGVPPSRQLMANWRALLAVAAMVAVVFQLQALGPAGPNPVMAAMAIALQIGLGGVTYVGIHLALWQVAGRPAGVETEVLGLISEWRADRMESAPEPS